MRERLKKLWLALEQNNQEMRGPDVEPLPSGWVTGSKRSVAEPPAAFWVVLGVLGVVILGLLFTIASPTN